MGVIYVISDQPRAGKTAICTTFAHELRQQGIKTSVFKPICSPIQTEKDPDGAIFQYLLHQPESDWPWHLPETGLTTKLLNEIKTASDKLLKDNTLLIVEGSSSISDEDSKQLANTLNAQILMIMAYKPGIGNSDLTRWQDTFGKRLHGCIVNKVTRHQSNAASKGLKQSLQSVGIPNFGMIPEDRRLQAITVGDLASHIGGEFITCSQVVQPLIENYMVGGLGLDSGQDYFKNKGNKAAIVRGDRPDIQMAALTTSTSCMVLTNGVPPIEYVRHESELEGIPIILVQSDTLTTMNLLNTVQNNSQFDHPEKLVRLADLINKHLDLEPLKLVGLDN